VQLIARPLLCLEFIDRVKLSQERGSGRYNIRRVERPGISVEWAVYFRQYELNNSKKACLRVSTEFFLPA
jgi:hypothetical protein